MTLSPLLCSHKGRSTGPRIGAFSNRLPGRSNGAPNPDSNGAHGEEEAQEAPRCHVTGHVRAGRCPNLLQRPRSNRSVERESLIFRASSRGRSRRGTPLQQIWTRSRPDSPQEGYSAGGGASAGRRDAGPSAGSWQRFSAWTTYVPLDHLRAVGPPGSRNTVVQRHASGPIALKWSKQIEGVTACETPSHHARRPVGRGTRTTPTPSEPPGSPVLTTRASRTAPNKPAHRPRRAQHPPTHPGETRAGHHDRPPPPPQRPCASHPANAFRRPRTTFRARKTRPSRPSPQPSRSMSSKPPLNNFPEAPRAPLRSHFTRTVSERTVSPMRFLVWPYPTRTVSKDAPPGAAPRFHHDTRRRNSPGRPASTTPFFLYYALSPFTVREKGA